MKSDSRTWSLGFILIATCGLHGCFDSELESTSDQYSTFRRPQATVEPLVDDSQVTIRSVSDARALRDRLVAHLWGKKGYPFSLVPAEIHEDVDPPLAGIEQYVSQVDRLVVELDHRSHANVYVLRPLVANRSLIVWHEGHSHSLGAGGGTAAIRRFLAAGHTVIASWMPQYGEAWGPEDFHVEATALRFHAWSPLRFFLEPVIAALNWAQSTGEFDRFSAAGVSGGGWTVTVLAALDSRISRSVPVAGSIPLHLRADPRDRGDAEQINGAFYSIAGYYDLYLLAAVDGRTQLQVLNRYDSCCFAGDAVLTYMPMLVQALTDIDPTGRLASFLDETHADHILSEHALETVVLPFID